MDGINVVQKSVRHPRGRNQTDPINSEIRTHLLSDEHNYCLRPDSINVKILGLNVCGANSKINLGSY